MGLATPGPIGLSRRVSERYISENNQRLFYRRWESS